MYDLNTGIYIHVCSFFGYMLQLHAAIVWIYAVCKNMILQKQVSQLTYVCSGVTCISKRG